MKINIGDFVSVDDGLLMGKVISLDKDIIELEDEQSGFHVIRSISDVDAYIKG